MRERREDGMIPGVLRAMLLAWAGSISIQAGGAHAQAVAEQPLTGTNPIKYRVNYRPTNSDVWQQYAETRSLDKANAIAAEVQSSGYQSQVVNDLTPFPHVFPDFAETSASATIPPPTGRRTITITWCPAWVTTTAGTAVTTRVTATDIIQTTGGMAVRPAGAAAGADTTGVAAGTVAPASAVVTVTGMTLT